MAVVIQASAVTTEKKQNSSGSQKTLYDRNQQSRMVDGKIGELRYADSQIGQSQIDGKRAMPATMPAPVTTRLCP